MQYIEQNFELRFHVTTFAEWKSRKERLFILNWMASTTIMAILRLLQITGVRKILEYHIHI